LAEKNFADEIDVLVLAEPRDMVAIIVSPASRVLAGA
jgi:hypothetical protein